MVEGSEVGGGGEDRDTTFITVTHPGYHSAIEAGQLGVVVGNLLFDNPAGQTDSRETQSVYKVVAHSPLLHLARVNIIQV